MSIFHVPLPKRSCLHILNHSSYTTLMYKIITSPLTQERPPISEEARRTRGYIVAIEPPVNLSPEIVNRALSNGTLSGRPLDAPEHLFSEISLIGSTEDRTVIYARLIRETSVADELLESRSLLIHRTRDLLGLLGVQHVMYDSGYPPISTMV